MRNTFITRSVTSLQHASASRRRVTSVRVPRTKPRQIHTLWNTQKAQSPTMFKSLAHRSPLALNAQKLAYPSVFARNYASRRFRRRVQQQEEEKWQQNNGYDTQLTENQQQQQQPGQQQQQGGWFSGFQPEQTTYGTQTSEDLLTPEVKTHIAKVYAVMGATMGVSALGCVGAISLGLLSPGIGIVSFLGALGCTFGSSYVRDENVRRILLYTTGALLGVGVAPLMAMAVSVDPMIIVNAFLGTVAIFGGFSIAALRAKHGSFLKWGGALGGILLFLVAGSLGHLILAPLGIGSAAFWAAFHNVSLYVGLGLFSIYIAYDTQRMIDRAASGIKDVTGDALSMFLNVFQIFIRLVQIFMFTRE